MPENKTLNEAYVAAYMNCTNPDMDGENPHFHNKYATLKATLKAVRDACKPNGIIYRQRMFKAENVLELHSSVMDGTGNEMSISIFPVEHVPNPQSFGSALTYAKRQQAQLDWGITGEEDDDGEAASVTKRKAAPSKTDPLKDAQQRCWTAIKAYCEKHPNADKDAMSNGIKKRPNYAETPEFYNSVAEEIEGDING